MSEATVLRAAARIALLPATLVSIVMLAAPSAMAQCETPIPGPIPAAHLLDSYLTGLNETYVSGSIFVAGDPAIHSGTAPFICRAEGDDSANGPCPVTAGTATDRQALIFFDWTYPDAVGCPAANTTGDSPNVAFLTSAEREGSGDHYGTYVLLSVGYQADSGAFLFDLAHPVDETGASFLPIAASRIPAPRVIEVTNNGDGTATLALTWSPAVSHDDCQQGVFTCTDFPGGVRPVVDDYAVYQRVTSCDPGTAPMSSLVSDWTEVARVTGATQATVTVPFSDSGDSCTYIALGIIAGGKPGGAVSAHIPLLEYPECDNDGVPDPLDNCPCTYNPDQLDSDGDGKGDACDPCPLDPSPFDRDSDADGVADCADNCPFVPNPDQSDRDLDRVGDACDICPHLANPDQSDRDSDQVGDVCDNCPDEANPDQADVDLDGRGDVCDVCPTVYNPAQEPEACRLDLSITISLDSSIGRGSGTLRWRTSTELGLVGFNALRLTNKGWVRLNDTIVRCHECITGLGADYTFIVPKHKGGQAIYVQVIRIDGTPLLFGPAIRE